MITKYEQNSKLPENRDKSGHYWNLANQKL
jgi:hypothetical protein